MSPPPGYVDERFFLLVGQLGEYGIQAENQQIFIPETRLKTGIRRITERVKKKLEQFLIAQ